MLQTPRPEAGLWPEGEKSVADLGLVKGSVVSVTTHETVLDALKSMHDHNITSVALVDRSSGYDQLIGSVSMRYPVAVYLYTLYSSPRLFS